MVPMNHEEPLRYLVEFFQFCVKLGSRFIGKQKPQRASCGPPLAGGPVMSCWAASPRATRRHWRLSLANRVDLQRRESGRKNSVDQLI